MPRKTKDTSGLTTDSGHPLTSKEAKFIEAYVSGKNQTQAYKEAYGEENTSKASQEGYKLMKKTYINEEIKSRMEAAKTESIATLSEIMQYYTGVMRGEVKDAFGLDASLAERTKCAVELAKRMSILEDRAAMQEESTPKIQITLDWGQNTNPQISSQNELLGHSGNTTSDSEGNE